MASRQPLVLVSTTAALAKEADKRSDTRHWYCLHVDMRPVVLLVVALFPSLLPMCRCLLSSGSRVARRRRLGGNKNNHHSNDNFSLRSRNSSPNCRHGRKEKQGLTTIRRRGRLDRDDDELVEKNDERQVAILSKALLVIYQQGGTLGVMQRSQGMQDYSASMLVQAAVLASRGDRGVASGMMNALLGSCCLGDDPTESSTSDRERAVKARKVCALMHAYDEQRNFLVPDLVALSLAYVATSAHASFHEQAEQFLRRAEAMYATDEGNKSDNSIGSTVATGSDHPPNWAELERHHGIQLLQDDDGFVVLCKPSGMVCYHAKSSVTPQPIPKQKRKHSSQNKIRPSLETCLLQNGVPLSGLNREGRGFVHRLDMGTSGCMVLAKTNRMHATLIAQFFLRQVEKSYQALVVVQAPLPERGAIGQAIDGRPAKSKYRLMQSYGSLVTRIQVKTQQGRRHQVRLHCAQGLQAPILLDPLYGGLAVLSRLAVPNSDESSAESSTTNVIQQQLVRELSKYRSAQQFCLHADTLSIPSLDIRVQASIPAWWQSLEDKLVLL